VNKFPGFLLRGFSAAVLGVGVLVAFSFPSRAGDKLKPEEIVAKNLESIGTAEARSAAGSRIVGGTVVATFAEPVVGQFTGRVVLASDGYKNLLSMQFDNPNYPQEHISFNGEDVLTAFVRAGVRSNFGDLIWTYKPLLKQGIIGGELSQAWPLYNLTDRKPKFSGSGTKKIDGRDVYVVNIVPRGGSDMTINLFFDAETFHHVRTEYQHVIETQIGVSVDSSKSQQPVRYKMIEEFGDFKKEGQLTLPHTYKITLELDARIGRAPFRGNWDMKLDQFGFGQPIPVETFNAAGKQ